MRTRLFALAAALLVMVAPASAQDAAIRIHPEKILVSNLSPYLTGACLEDVNHEVYGGVYSQMIFGESFQEPGSGQIDGFRAYGGTWTIKDNCLVASGDAGPKLVSVIPDFADGEIGAKLMLPAGEGNAGFIVKLIKPGIGADNCVGYEISLDTNRQVLVLGRHNRNWESIKDTPCALPTGQWIELVVKMHGDTIEALVDGKSVLTYQEEALRRSGTFALRPWMKTATYKDLYVRTNGKLTSIALTEPSSPFGEVSGMWSPIRQGTAAGHAAIDTTDPWVGRQCQTIDLTGGKGEIGIENTGLNRRGMAFVKGKDYEGSLRVRVSKPTEFCVALQSGDGSKTYAESRLSAKPSGWQQIPFKLIANGNDASGRFSIILKEPGSISLGYAFLQPGEWGCYKGLPCRKDVVDGLVKQGVTVLRYGGSMVNADEYRWKKMIGPRDQRPIYKGTWYPYSTNGWGIVDFLSMCDSAGFLGIPAFNMDETPRDMADFMEYANGPVTSQWGRKRAEDGHPKPLGVRVIELGNEEHVNEDYWRRFKPMAEAIWAADPNVTLVVGDLMYSRPIEDPLNYTGNPFLTSLETHKKILELAAQHNREVWFDVHLGTDSPYTPNERRGAVYLTEGLRKFDSKAKFKVVVFELNSGSHGIRRMLGNACAINELEQAGNDVPVVTSANCLQPDGQNDNAWDQGLLFLDQSKVWAQPPYYVTQMLSRNYLPEVIATEVDCPANTLNVTARRSKDGKILQLQVVNMADHAVTAKIDLGGYQPSRRTAKVEEVSGALDDVNTAENPTKIAPKTREWRADLSNGQAAYTFPAYSFTVIRLD